MSLGFITSERGSGILENMICVLLFGIASISTIPTLSSSLHANRAAQNHAATMAELEQIVSDYQSMSFNSLLGLISSNVEAIANGGSSTFERSSDVARADFDITLTAIKNTSIGAPEAVRVRIDVQSRRSFFGDRTYSFETIISELGS